MKNRVIKRLLVALLSVTTFATSVDLSSLTAYAAEDEVVEEILEEEEVVEEESGEEAEVAEEEPVEEEVLEEGVLPADEAETGLSEELAEEEDLFNEDSSEEALEEELIDSSEEAEEESEEEEIKTVSVSYHAQDEDGDSLSAYFDIDDSDFSGTDLYLESVAPEVKGYEYVDAEYDVDDNYAATITNLQREEDVDSTDVFVAFLEQYAYNYTNFEDVVSEDDLNKVSIVFNYKKLEEKSDDASSAASSEEDMEEADGTKALAEELQEDEEDQEVISSEADSSEEATSAEEAEEETEEEQDQEEAEEVKSLDVTFTAEYVDEDGKAIGDDLSSTLTVYGRLSLTSAPEIEGYVFDLAKVDGNEATAITKTTETKDDQEVTTYAYTADGEDVEITSEDVTVTYVYKQDEKELNDAKLVFTAEYVDKDGKALEDAETEELDLGSYMNLTTAPKYFEGYKFVEAKIGDTVVSALKKETIEDEESKQVVYSYVADGSNTEVTKDTTVSFVYAAEKEILITAEYVDEDGNALSSVASEELKVEDSLDLTKVNKVIDGYKFKKATVEDATVTEIKKDAETGEFTLETESGSVAVDKDLTVKFVYAKSKVAVKLTANVVDEFGKEIDPEFTGMKLPEFKDTLVLNDVKKAPVKNVRIVRKTLGFIKLYTNYSYVEASLNGEVIAGLKKEEIESDKETAASDDLAAYSYTLDGETYKDITEDAVITFTYKLPENQRTSYVYDDDAVVVTAVLENQNAVPDNAELVVKPITSGFEYESYMAALNANASELTESEVSEESETKAFNRENTLLYDISFMVPNSDEDPTLVEYEPEEGAVRVSMEFKENQLKEQIKTEDAKDITVVHLPENNGVIETEKLENSAAVEGAEVVTFTTESFSVFAIKGGSSKWLDATPGPSVTAESILGNAWYYGIVANTWEFNGEAETNFAVKTLTGEWGNPLNGGQTGVTDKAQGSNSATSMLANLNGSTTIKGVSETVTVPSKDVADRLRNGTTGYLNFVYDSKSNIESRVASMISGAGVPSGDSIKDYNNLPWGDSAQKLELDFTQSGSGTFYIHADKYQALLNAMNQNGALTIRKNSDQRIVFDFGNNSYVHINKYTIIEDGNQYDSVGLVNNSTTMMDTIENIVFYAPGAGQATLDDAGGIFVMPNATVDCYGVDGGWLVANVVRTHCEWHFTNGHLPDTYSGGTAQLKAVKNIDNSAATVNGFKFSLDKKSGNGWEHVEDKYNNGSDVSFSDLSYTTKEIGDHIYRISESATQTIGGIVYTAAVTAYYAKVTVSEFNSKNSNGTTNYGVTTSVKYYADEACTRELSGTPTFNNETPKTGSLTVTKIQTGNIGVEQTGVLKANLKFTVKNSAGQVVATIPGSSNVSGGYPTWTVKDLPYDTYTVTEVADGITFNEDGIIVNDWWQNTISYNVGDTTTQDVVLSAERADNSISVTNAYTHKYGKIRVTKADRQDPSRKLAGAVFTYYSDPECTNAEGTMTTGADGTATSSSIQHLGTFYVKETQAPDGYLLDDTNVYKVVLTNDGETVDVNGGQPFLDTPNTGDLKVTKHVDSVMSEDKTREFSFTVTLDGDAGKAVNGTYGDMTFTNGVASFKLRDGQTANATGLPNGVAYTVTEETITGFSTTSTGETGSITYGTPAAASFTNSRQTGDVEISKKVVSADPADENDVFTFNLTTVPAVNGSFAVDGSEETVLFNNGSASLQIKGSGSKKIVGLPMDVKVTAVEVANSKYSTDMATQTTMVQGGATGKMAFTNTRKTGDLDVTKTVVSSTASDKTKEFSFTVTLEPALTGEFGGMSFKEGVAAFTLKDGETRSATGLPAGTKYTVEEKADGAFVTTKTGETGTISAEKSTAAFTNTKDEGGLIVSKSVVSALQSDKDAAYHFTVTLDDATVSGTYGDMEFKAGKAEFDLKDGETMSASGLAKGVKYTVTETAVDGMTTSSEGATGTIAEKATQTAAFVNTRDNGSLTISKTVLGGTTEDSTKAFQFDIALTPAISGTYAMGEESVIFESGKATVTVNGGASKTITGLPVGIEYAVTEQNADGFILTGKTGDAGKITTTPATAAFTNTRKTGGLKVSKTVISDAASDKTDKEFTFTVTLEDDKISGQYGEMSFTNGVSTFTLKHGTSMTASGLPAGIGYTVTEAAAEGFALTGKTGETGTIVSETTKEAAFTNSRDKGDIEISKTVVSPVEAEKTAEYTFTIELSDKTVSGTFSDVIFTDGKATVTVKGGDSRKIEGLPKGVGYTVTETTKTGFTVAPSTGKVTGEVGDGKTAAFTNTRQLGELDVTKIVVSTTGADKNENFSFKVTLSDKTLSGTFGDMEFTNGVAAFTLKHGQTKAAADLPTGISYKVEEETAEGFITTKTGETGEISATKAVAAFTNTRSEGGLQVYKKVSSPVAADKDMAFTFTVKLADTSLNETYDGVTFEKGVATFQLRDGESKTITGLKKGLAYEVYETADDNFSVSWEGRTGVISDETTAVATCTNTRKSGSLAINKTVVSSIPAEADKEFRFHVVLADKSVSGTFGQMSFTNGEADVTVKGGATVTADGLPNGVAYTVTEESDPSFVLKSKTDDTGKIPTTGTVTAKFTNERSTGSIEISKTVVSPVEAEKTAAYSFTIELSDKTISGTFSDVAFTNGVATVTVNGGDSKVIEGLPQGVTYTVKEAVKDNFTVEPASGEISGTVAAEKSVAAFTNSRKTGELEVSKTVVSSTTADKNKDFNFTVTLGESITGTFGDMSFENGVAKFALKDGAKLTATGLPIGVSYEVKEETASGFVTTKSGETGSISATRAVASFTNTKDEGGLLISKKVESSVASDHDKNFTFTIELGDTSINETYDGVVFKNGVGSITLKDTESKSISGLPQGMKYTVTETADDDFTTTWTGETGTISGNTAQAAFTNTRKGGGLSISKKVVSPIKAEETKEFEFHVSLGDKSISGTFGDMSFEKGEADVTVAGNATKTATGLPNGIAYTVTEKDVPNFKLESKTGDTGVIPVGEVATVLFNNKRDTGSLSVEKKLVSEAKADADKSFDFTVKLSDETIGGTFGDMSFTNGVAHVTVKDSEKKTATGLPLDIYYTVTEDEASKTGFQVTGEVANQKLTETAPTVTITNTRETGTLTISKKVVSEAAADHTQKFHFTIRLDDESIGGAEGKAYGDLTFTNGVAEADLQDGDSLTATGLPTGVGYTVTETELEGFKAEGNTSKGTISTTESKVQITNTRDLGGLIVKKTLVSEAAADQNQVFTFHVSLADKTISGTYGDAEFAKGEAEVKITGAGEKEISGLPTGVAFTVTEDNAEGFTQSGEVKGTVATTKPVAEITNTREQGELTVEKKLVSDAAADADKTFTFTIELSDKTIGGAEGKAYGDLTFRSGVATVELKGGQSAKATGLPTGVAYTVTEAASEDFEVTGNAATGTISKSPASVVITNTKKTGGFKVAKNLVSKAAADADQEFDFTVTLSDTSITSGEGKDYGMTFANGVATFQLKGGESMEAKNLPIGITYTVTEKDAAGFVATGNNATGEVTTTPATVTITNTRDEGGLILHKELVSKAAADANQEFTFHVVLKDTSIAGSFGDASFADGKADVVLKGGETKNITGLPTGVGYTVTEDSVPGFQQTGITNAEGTIEKTAANVTITNKRDEGGLKVSKVLVSDAQADKDQSFVFTVKLGDETIGGTFGDMTFDKGVATVNLKGGESAEATGLPTDVTYEVTEADADGFKLTGKTGDKGTISTTASEAVFTNTRDTGDLEVSKKLESKASADKNQTFTFTVALSDTSIGGAAGKAYGEMTFVNGVATFQLKGGESKTATGLPAGVAYTVTEADADDFTVTGNTSTGVISTTASSKTITNTRNTGDLNLKKTLISDRAADADQNFTFVVTLEDKTINGVYGDAEFVNGVAEVQIKGSETKTVKDLPIGLTYTVTEKAAAGFEQTSKIGTTGTISSTTATAEITNTRDTGKLTVSKKVVSNKPADANQTFKFHVDLEDGSISGEYGQMSFADGKAVVELKGGESKTATGLPTDVKYTVTEESVSGFKATGFTDEVNSKSTGTISRTDAVIDITNTRDNGNLTVSKKLISDAAADQTKDFHFTIRLDEAVNGKFGDLTFTEGVATADLKGGESKTAEGLPTDVHYTVTEDTTEDFTVSGNTATGVISTTDSKVEITNEKKTGGLTVTKEVISDAAADLTKDFNFTVKLDDTSISSGAGKDYGMTFANGVATFALKNGETAAAKNLPIGIGYTVTEEEAEGFVATGNTATGVISTTPANVKITNTRDKGGLILHKELVSDAKADKEVLFNFHVSLGDKGINGTYGDANFVNGEASLQLKGGDTKNITGLPTGISYEVTEDNTEGFSQTGITNATGTIATTAATVTATNSRDTGDLKISKVLVSDAAADKNQSFEFTIQLSDTTISKTYSDVAFDGGKATVNLKGGESKVISGLPTGIDYEVTEKSVEGLVASGNTGVKGTITTGTADATYTNTRETGNLSVSKKLISDKAADAEKTYNFTVTLSDTSITGTYGDMAFTNGVANVEVKKDEVKTAQNLPTGITYTVTEDAASRAGFRVSGEVANQELTVTGATVEITNTRETGKLTVSKKLVSKAAADADQEFTFTVTLDDTSIGGAEGKAFGGMTFTNGVATVNLKGGESATAEGLPTEVGYTVTETEAAGFVATGNTQKGEITTTPASVEITNTRDEGGLVLSKQIVSKRAADADQQFTFTVKLNDTSINGTFGDASFTNGEAKVILKGGESANISGLPTDLTYTVTEANAPGFKQTGSTNASGTIQKEAAKVEFTNTRDTGDLKVSKTVVSDAKADKDQKFSFTITLADKTIAGIYGDMTFDQGVATVELKDGESATATGLPTDIDYTVTETGTEGFQQTGKTGDSGSIKTGLTEAKFTNTRDTGDLSLEKKVEGVVSSTDTKDFTFTVTLGDESIGGAEGKTYGDMTFANGVATVKVADGETKTATGLPTGISYEIKEQTENGFVTVATGETGEITTKGSAAVFTNKRNSGSLSVTKTVVSSTASDKTKDFTFKVTLDDKLTGTFGEMSFTEGVATFTLKDGETRTATDLPTGLNYKVEEEKDGAFVTTKTGETGTISAEVSKAAFTNTKDEGGLLVSKSVVSDLAADKTTNYQFTVTLDDTSVNGTYGDMNFTDGVAAFTLKDGETKLADGLAKGIRYTVTEEAAEGMTTKAEGETGKIQEKATALAAFTNTRKTGELNVTKKVESFSDADKAETKTFGFRVTLDPAISGVYNGVEFVNGQATFALADGQKKEIKGLPTGVKYTVEEEADGQFTTVKTGETGTIEETTATAAFTNTRKSGGLDVSKSVLSSRSSDKSTRYNFRVTLSDPTVNGDAGDMTFRKGVAEFKLRDGETASATGLPTGISYKVEEETPDGFTVIKKGETGSIAESTSIAGFTNARMTEASIEKIWDDEDNRDGKRPKAPNGLSVQLMQNGTAYGEPLQLTEANGWKGTIENLPDCDETGKAYEYTWKELNMPEGYKLKDSSVNGTFTTLTNAYDPEKLTVSGTKYWEDGNDQDGKRPTSITVNLIKNGTVYESQVVKPDAEGNWTYSFENLYKYDAGKDTPNVYAVTENAVAEYATLVEGYDLKNSYTPGMTSLSVTKAWIDSDNQDNLRPDSIDVQLYANGVTYGSPVALSNDNGWVYTWTDLPIMNAGRDIDYTVEELTQVPGYTTAVTGNAKNGFTITNTHEVADIRITGSKIWADQGNADGIRPDRIVLHLYRNGIEIAIREVRANILGDWNFRFEDLPAMVDGERAVYTITEEVVDGYESAIDFITNEETGDIIATLRNTHTPDQPDIPDQPDLPDYPAIPEAPQTPQTPEVLGARRTQQEAGSEMPGVLGARRAHTADSNLGMNILMMLVSLVSFLGLLITGQRKKKK